MPKTPAAGHLQDAWIQIDDSPDPDFFVRFLDGSRARILEAARRDPERAFAHLALRPGLSILDCGCGTGDTLALIAGLVAPGQAVGGDLSEIMLIEARARNSGGPDNLQFEKMDVQALRFPDGSFDRVTAAQLLIHVPDPEKALDEMCRVTAPGGRVSLSDMDWDSLAVGTSDPEPGRKFARMFCDGIRNGLVVRKYAGWLSARGFQNVQVLPMPMLFTDWAQVKQWVFDPALRQFADAGTMTSEECAALLGDMERNAASNSLFVASTLYTVVADKP